MLVTPIRLYRSTPQGDGDQWPALRKVAVWQSFAALQQVRI